MVVLAVVDDNIALVPVIDWFINIDDDDNNPAEGDCEPVEFDAVVKFNAVTTFDDVDEADLSLVKVGFDDTII